jgi:methylglutaconyl-CoA hydratase
MTDGKVLTEIDPRGCATVTLDRPDRGNALDPAMLTSLHETLAVLRDRAEVRVVILRGAGRHFCSGMDISAIRPEGVLSHVSGIGPVYLLMDELSKPAICVVQGAAIGAGCALVACCDVAIAATEASFAIPEVRLGLAPGVLTPFFHERSEAGNSAAICSPANECRLRELPHLGLVHEVARRTPSR